MAHSRLACLNIQMDQAAKTKLLTKQLLDSSYKIPSKAGSVPVKDVRWLSLWQRHFKHLNGKIILNHWAMKEHFLQKVTQTIDWESSDKVTKGFPLAQHQWVAKLATKYLLDGKICNGEALDLLQSAPNMIVLWKTENTFLNAQQKRKTTVEQQVTCRA